MKFSELQQQLKENFGIDHLADIARELGVSPQAVSNWKARDQVPYKYVVKIRNLIREFGNYDDTSNSIIYPRSPLVRNNQDESNNDQKYSIIDILFTLAKNIRIIIIIPLILCVFQIIYLQYFAMPLYISTSKIISSGGSGGSRASMQGLAAQFGISLGAPQQETKWVYKEILKSRTIARSMLDQKFDTEKFGRQKQLFTILTSGGKSAQYDEYELQIKAIDALMKMIEVNEDKINGIYTIRTLANEPKFAAELNKTLIEQLDSHQKEYNNTRISEARRFVEKRLIATEEELNIAEEALKNFHDQNRRIENSPSLLLEQQRLRREVNVLTSVFTVLKEQLENTKIQEVKESNYVIILDKPEIPIYRTKPKKKQLVIITGFFGIGIGLFFSLTREYYDNMSKDNKKKFWHLKSLIISGIVSFFRRNK